MDRKKRKSLLWEKLESKICVLCGLPMIYSQCNIDHIVPKILGGRNALFNLQLVHKRCNSEKGCDLKQSFPQKYFRKVKTNKP